MVYSQQTATFYGGEKARAKVEDPGWVFIRHWSKRRIPFEMVHDKLLDRRTPGSIPDADSTEYRGALG